MRPRKTTPMLLLWLAAAASLQAQSYDKNRERLDPAFQWFQEYGCDTVPLAARIQQGFPSFGGLAAIRVGESGCTALLELSQAFVFAATDDQNTPEEARIIERRYYSSAAGRSEAWRVRDDGRRTSGTIWFRWVGRRFVVTDVSHT